MNENNYAYVGNKYHRRMVSLPILHYGIPAKIAPKPIKNPPKRIERTPIVFKKNTVNQSLEGSKVDWDCINKTCIDSRITLGLTKYKQIKVPIKKQENSFLLKVLSQSEMVKKEKKDVRYSIISFSNMALQRKNNIGIHEKIEFQIPDYEALSRPNFKLSKSNTKKNLEKSCVIDEKSTVVECSERMEQEIGETFDGSTISNNCPNENLVKLNKTTVDGRRHYTKVALIKKIQQLSETENEDNEDYLSYKKKFKIRPRYTTLQDYK